MRFDNFFLLLMKYLIFNINTTPMNQAQISYAFPSLWSSANNVINFSMQKVTDGCHRSCNFFSRGLTQFLLAIAVSFVSHKCILPFKTSGSGRDFFRAIWNHDLEKIQGGCRAKLLFSANRIFDAISISINYAIVPRIKTTKARSKCQCNKIAM